MTRLAPARAGRAATLAPALAALILLTVLAACSAPSGAPVRTAQSAATSPVGATRPASHRTSPPATASPAQSTPAQGTLTEPSALPVAPPSAASLPQTSALPHTGDAAFASLEHDVWLAVTTGNPRYALPAFFPEKAYVQVKAIADPAADWRGRLWYEFTLDLAAAHQLVKPDATLIKVVVATPDAQWIAPGGCYNSSGYWHLPGARVVYRQGGGTHSFGIASLISWRGDWYVVHFGAVLRAGASGIVDDPEAGEGIPGPPGGC